MFCHYVFIAMIVLGRFLLSLSSLGFVVIIVLDWLWLQWSALDIFLPWSSFVLLLLSWSSLDWVLLSWSSLDWFLLSWSSLDWILLSWSSLDWILLSWSSLDWFLLSRLDGLFLPCSSLTDFGYNDRPWAIFSCHGRPLFYFCCHDCLWTGFCCHDFTWTIFVLLPSSSFEYFCWHYRLSIIFCWFDLPLTGLKMFTVRNNKLALI